MKILRPASSQSSRALQVRRPRVASMYPTSDWVDTQTRAPLFHPTALRPLHDLNRRLFDILIDELRRSREISPATAVLGAKLAPLGDDTLWRLARVPICWVEADFLNETAWTETGLTSRGAHALPESPLPRARAFELAGLTYALASSIAKSSPDAACIMFGMRPAVADAFAGFSVETIHRLGQSRAHWVRPRWFDTPQDWQRLIATAESAEATRLPPVSLRALNRLLVDLEPAP